ncbi:MAG TPA: SPW repeat protein [Clostridia bacterium]|nr:SPW repeat protein [Clostridia bacterium]
MNRGQAITASTVNLIAGLWLIIAPFVLGFSEITAATINDIVLGAIIAIVSAIRIFSSVRWNWLSWLNVLLGFWLIIAPFVLAYPAATPRFNDIILGIVVIIAGTWSATSTPTQG